MKMVILVLVDQQAKVVLREGLVERQELIPMSTYLGFQVCLESGQRVILSISFSMVMQARLMW
jgi:hypothetical protein